MKMAGLGDLAKRLMAGGTKVEESSQVQRLTVNIPVKLYGAIYEEVAKGKLRGEKTTIASVVADLLRDGLEKRR